MEAVTAYKSIDGKVFPTMGECVFHEDSLKKERAISFLVENNIKFYDEFREELKPDDSQAFQNEVYYICFTDVNTEELLKLKEYLNHYYGFDLQFGCRDLIYYYEDEYGIFSSLEEKIESIKEDLHQYKEVKRELEE